MAASRDDRHLNVEPHGLLQTVKVVALHAQPAHVVAESRAVARVKRSLAVFDKGMRPAQKLLLGPGRQGRTQEGDGRDGERSEEHGKGTHGAQHMSATARAPRRGAGSLWCFGLWAASAPVAQCLSVSRIRTIARIVLLLAIAPLLSAGCARPYAGPKTLAALGAGLLAAGGA